MSATISPPRPEDASRPGIPGADKVPAARRPVLDIEGVGDYYASKMRKLGVVSIGDLMRCDPARLAADLDIPATVVRNWRAMGELIDVHGIGPQFAELLVRCGVRSIADLAGTDATELLARVLMTGSERMMRIQGAPIGHRHVSQWIDQARRYDSSMRAS